MARSMSTREARANFSELLGIVYYTKEPVIVERKGKPYAVMISLEAYERLHQQEQHDWDTIDRFRETHPDVDHVTALAEATAVVETVRQERHERRKNKTKGRY